MNSIILHTGSKEISYEDLKEIPTPEPSQTWTPIPHVEPQRYMVNCSIAGSPSPLITEPTVL